RIRKPHDALDAFINLYAEDAVMYFQGRNWPYAGKHAGRTAIAKIFREGITLFTAPLEFRENRLWILDDERLLWWWRSRSVTFKDKPMSNSGLTVLRFRDNLIIEHQEYTEMRSRSAALASQDVGSAAVFIASDAAQWISGSTLLVSGGWQSAAAAIS
ncbi:MAG: nuclear transport factor 2 family protein, partial [Spongiibacteraceae bacterium]